MLPANAQAAFNFEFNERPISHTPTAVTYFCAA